MTSKEEWFAIVDQEEGQKLVLNVMEEVLDKTQNVIFRRRIENQLLPYTLSYVRNTFLGVAECRYMQHDTGELDATTWEADEEPEPVAPDSWARGILEVKRFTTSQKANKMRDNLLAPQALGQESSQPSNTTMHEGLDAPMPIEPFDAKTAELKRRESFRSLSSSRNGKRASADSRALAAAISMMEEPKAHKQEVTADMIIKEENRKILSRLKQKDNGKANFTYDHEGRIILLRKGKVGKAAPPSVQATIVESKVSPVAPKKATPSSRPYGAKKLVTKPVDSTITLKPDVSSDYPKDANKIISEAFTPDTSIGTTHLIDLIKPAPGVTIKEGEAVRKGEPLTSQKALPTPKPPSTGPSAKAPTDPVLSKILEKARPIVQRPA